MNYKRIVPNSISGISLVLGVISIFYTIEENFLQRPCASSFPSWQIPWTEERRGPSAFPALSVSKWIPCATWEPSASRRLS